MKVVLSHRAEKRLDQLANYLEKEWGKNSKDKFLKHFTSVVLKIAEYPFLFPESTKKEGVRRCVLSKHTNLYYRVTDIHIEIITIHDSRQNPDSLKL